MVMLTGREVAAGGEHGVYGEFRARFPRLDAAALREHGREWRAVSEVYRGLLDPSHVPHAALALQIARLNTFSRGMYPLVMRVLLDESRGLLARDELIGILDDVQALLLRRAAVGLPTERLVARLCRAHAGGAASLRHAISRITPSDDRMRAALTFTPLPHASYVLGRIAGVDSVEDLVVDHIVPVAPTAAWSGDGARAWADYTHDEQNSHRALAGTIGNLALLEDELALRGFDASFPEKRDVAYAQSSIRQTNELAATPAWGTAAIADRTARLTELVLQVWRRPEVVAIDDDGLTPILDAVLRRGFPPGWEREFSYVEFRGEHWEVPDVRYLFNRIFTRLWAEARESVERFSAGRGGPVYPARAWNGHWDTLDDDHFLYMGWDLHYMLTAVQGVLEQAGWAPEVFVKYSYIGTAMGDR
jgi:hypothetical protein